MSKIHQVQPDTRHFSIDGVGDGADCPFCGVRHNKPCQFTEGKRRGTNMPKHQVHLARVRNMGLRV